MVELTCPWCEERLAVEPHAEASEQSCPACLTSWCYEDVPAAGMAAAA